MYQKFILRNSDDKLQQNLLHKQQTTLHVIQICLNRQKLDKTKTLAPYTQYLEAKPRYSNQNFCVARTGVQLSFEFKRARQQLELVQTIVKQNISLLQLQQS